MAHGNRFQVDHDVPKEVLYEELQYIEKEDLVIEPLRYEDNSDGFYRVNESAIKITHTPTGLYFISYTQRSQHMNRNKALLELNILVGRCFGSE